MNCNKIPWKDGMRVFIATEDDAFIISAMNENLWAVVVTNIGVDHSAAIANNIIKRIISDVPQ